MTVDMNGSAPVMRCQVPEAAVDPTSVDPDYVVRRPITDLLREALNLGYDLLEACHPAYVAVDKRGEQLMATDGLTAFGHSAILLGQAADFERHAERLRSIADRCGRLCGTSEARRALVDAAMRYHNPIHAGPPHMIDLVALAEAAAREDSDV